MLDADSSSNIIIESRFLHVLVSGRGNVATLEKMGVLNINPTVSILGGIQVPLTKISVPHLTKYVTCAIIAIAYSILLDAAKSPFNL